jgi:hypothetical protein
MLIKNFANSTGSTVSLSLSGGTKEEDKLVHSQKGDFVVTKLILNGHIVGFLGIKPISNAMFLKLKVIVTNYGAENMTRECI